MEGAFDSSAVGNTNASSKKQYPVANAEAALMLLEWLPDMTSHDLQVWTADCLRRLCCHANHNRMHCCNAGLIEVILRVITQHETIDPLAMGK